jgi:hypothetical protein
MDFAASASILCMDLPFKQWATSTFSAKTPHVSVTSASICRLRSPRLVSRHVRGLAVMHSVLFGGSKSPHLYAQKLMLMIFDFVTMIFESVSRTFDSVAMIFDFVAMTFKTVGKKFDLCIVKKFDSFIIKKFDHDDIIQKAKFSSTKSQFTFAAPDTRGPCLKDIHLLILWSFDKGLWQSTTNS